MNRRYLLIAASALLATSALTACSASPGNIGVAQAADDVAIIAAALSSTVPAIATVFGVPPATVSTINVALKSLNDAATALKTAASQTAAQSIVKQVIGDISAIAGVVAGIPGLPPEVTLALAAAQALLPALSSAIGLFSAIRPGGMSASHARAVLKALATK